MLPPATSERSRLPGSIGGAPALCYAIGLAAGCALALGEVAIRSELALLLAAAGLAFGRTSGWVATCFAAGYLTCGLGVGERAPQGQALEARVEVRSPWTLDESGQRARARASLLFWRSKESGHLSSGAILLDVAGDWPRPPVGTVLWVRGDLRRPLVFRNRGEATSGAPRLVVKASRWLLVQQTPGLFQHGANQARRRIDRWLPPTREDLSPGTALARALVLGDGSGLSMETWRALRQAGLAHLAAVSGFNVAVLVTVVWVLAQLVGISGTWRHGLSGCSALLYLWVLGEQPSAARATAMAAWVALAFAFRALPWAFQLMGWAGVVLLLFEPSWVSDLSFQLTFAATLGLLVGTPTMATSLRDGGLPGWAATAIGATVSAQLATAPWSLVRFHSLVGFGVVWNLLAAPWSAIAFLASFLAIPLLAWGGWVARATLWFLDLWAAPLAWLRDSTPIWGTHPWCAHPILAWAGSITLALALMSRWTARLRWGLGFLGVLTWSLPWLQDQLNQAVAGVPVRLVAFDVGQGDATLFEGQGGRVLVDGGGWEGGDFGGRVLAPALAAEGIQWLDAVILSHFDRDHCRGLLDLTAFLPVADVWTGPGWEASECGRALRQRARRRAGTLVAEDALRYGVWSFRVLAPDLRDLGRISLQSNDASVVLLAEAAGRRVLMLGDLEARGERWLAYRRAEMLLADVIKVGHHGSPTSTTSRLLEAVSPRLALISAGQDNAFGHPAPAVTERLKVRRVLTLRTDELGQIVLEPTATSGWRISLPGSITNRQ